MVDDVDGFAYIGRVQFVSHYIKRRTRVVGAEKHNLQQPEEQQELNILHSVGFEKVILVSV